MSSKASVKTTTKLYDFLENDSSMQVMTVTLLSSILIISTVMLVLVIVAVATFRLNTFNIYPLKNFTIFLSFLHDVVIDFNPQQMNV